MKHKKYSIFSLLLALVLITGILCTAFAATESEVGADASDASNVMYCNAANEDEPAEAADAAAWMSDGSFAEYESAPGNGSDANTTEVPVGKFSDEAIPFGLGSLAPGGAYSIDSQRMAAGQRITVNVTYTPTASNLRIGIRNNATNRTYTRLVSGGSGAAVITIPTTGTYSIYVANPSTTVPARFSVSYFLQ